MRARQQQLSKKNKRLFIFAIAVAILVTMVCVLTGAAVRQGYSIEIGSVSPKRFKAPRDAVNVIETSRLRDIAADSVVPLYRHDTDKKNAVLAQLDDFFNAISTVRANYLPILTPETSTSQEGQTPKPTPTETWEPSILPIEISKDQMEWLVTSESPLFNKFRDDVKEITDNALEAGIKEDTVAKNLLAIREEMETQAWDDKEKVLAYELISSVIKPNLVVDNEATEKLRLEKIEEVEPVIFRRGEKIVDEDEVITEEIYYVLNELGYINKGLFENIVPALGAVAFVALIAIVGILYLRYYYQEVGYDVKKGLLLLVLYTLCVIISRFILGANIYFVPIILFTMLIAILIESRVAVVMSIVLTLITAVIFFSDLKFVIFFIINGMFAGITAKYLVQRSKVFTVALAMTAMSAFSVTALYLLTDKGYTVEMFNSIVYASLCALLSVVLCIGTLPFWEASFGVVTPLKLLDLTNPNSELLKRLTIEAPGTYHHSLIVANLAETAAYDVGASTVLARVGGYYHDIGKIKYPQYFSENQLGDNPHDRMAPRDSVEVITEHVRYGVELADSHKLPYMVKDIIEQHHGSTILKFFYFKEKEANPDEEIEEKDFRYHHPIPQFREAAIIMLADTAEAAVRSMAPKGKTTQEIEDFVRVLVKDKLDDGQLNHSGLAIDDLEKIITAFMRVFKGMYHERVPYPKTATSTPTLTPTTTTSTATTKKETIEKAEPLELELIVSADDEPGPIGIMEEDRSVEETDGKKD